MNEHGALSDQDFQAVAKLVFETFLIDSRDSLLEPIREAPKANDEWALLVKDAASALHSIVCAAGVPFTLSMATVRIRHFDRYLGAERIRQLCDADSGAGLSYEQETRATSRAYRRCEDFLTNERDFVARQVVELLEQSYRSEEVRHAAPELLVQALISTWTVFETFASSFIVRWINADPQRARPVMEAADLRSYFGKSPVAIETLDDFGFDLTHRMGDVLFRGRRLDGLGVIRPLLEVLLNDAKVRFALGDDMWLLNQRRHLFVHKRGIVDDDYLRRSKDRAPMAERLKLKIEDIERSLNTVQQAILSVVAAARRADLSPNHNQPDG